MAVATTQLTKGDLALADRLRVYRDDPLGFVRVAFPWGEPGYLRDYDGPDEWQTQFLAHLGEQVRARCFDGHTPVDAIKEAVSSGHGIGKGVLSGFIATWILTTRPYSQGTITANTYQQLENKTWATIRRWVGMSIAAHWFTIGAEKIVCNFAPDSWFVSAQTCREENSEAFAGQHAANSTSWYLFDESSSIPEKIWEVAEGGLTDGEPMFFAWGNPTRNTGKFYRIVFGADRKRWGQRVIDSRTCRHTNKVTINEWLADYGEDSDFFRVRVRGLAPSQSDMQYIDNERVYAAQQREVLDQDEFEPLILGLDVSRGGADPTIARYRRGRDARSIPPIRIKGNEARDTMVLATKFAEILSDQRPQRKVAMMFVDAGYGGQLCDRLHQLGYRNVVEVNFASRAPDNHFANMRAYMMSRLKDWLLVGSIDNDPKLETDLTAPGFKQDAQDRLLIESKESMQRRGYSSTDESDALMLCLSQDVAPPAVPDMASRRPTTAYRESWMG